MIFPDNTAYMMFLNAIALLGPSFVAIASLLGTFFAITLFAAAVITVTTTFTISMIAALRYKSRNNVIPSQDHKRQELQHRCRHTRTRAKACPKQFCCCLVVTQPLATLGMWK